MASSVLAFGNVVDTYVDMGVADADGTTVTATIMDNGTQGTNGGWTFPQTATGLSVHAHRSGMGLNDIVTIGATQYPTSHTSRTLRVSHDTAIGQRTVELAVSSLLNTRRCAIACWIEFGLRNVAAAAGLADYFLIVAATGDYTTAQLDIDGSGNPNGYRLNIETAGSSTIHSDYYAITPGTKKWICLVGDFSDARNGFSRMRIWDDTGRLEHELGALDDVSGGGGIIDHIRIGNNETATDQGQFSYFENVLINYTGKWIPPSNPVVHGYGSFAPSNPSGTSKGFQQFPPNPRRVIA